MKAQSGLNYILTIGIIVVLLVTAVAIYSFPDIPQPSAQSTLKQFSSYDELKEFLTTNIPGDYYGGYGMEVMRTTSDFAMPLAAGIAEGSGASDYSTTNIQVEGVDEADIIKNDGKYIYVISGSSTSGGNIFILDAYPAEDAEILSAIEFDDETVSEMYVNGDNLIVFAQDYEEVVYEDIGATRSIGMPEIWPPIIMTSNTIIKVFDIS
ncbi:MAG: beta-propeller domain-containing protein, partial [Thermoplasmatales archaeon]